MMRLAFIDIAASYDAKTPYQRALGGTQAAVCYLAAELAKAGASAALINQNRALGAELGVESLPPEALDDEAVLRGFSHLVLNGRWTEKLAQSLKKRTAAPLIGWMHEACFAAPYVLPLKEFSAFVFVSAWQKNLNAPLVPPPVRAAVMSNGVAPSFHDLPLMPSKEGPPVAVYAGSSKRGLLLLPEIIPLMHKARPDLRFEIYSDGVIGTDEAGNHAFREKLAALPGVAHRGAVDQKELASRFARAHYFLSPNTYPETFCIALAEALRAGLFCIGTQRAALPETAGGFAALLPVDGADDPSWRPETLRAEVFAAHALSSMSQWESRAAHERQTQIENQIAFARRYDWQVQAHNWLEFLRAA
ncbi:MAG TPA: glycosyltransferase [Alphaproteobacteria bacterium]|nr:glycosyltransferase [Alphaproteobacteria bacterium]